MSQEPILKLLQLIDHHRRTGQTIETDMAFVDRHWDEISKTITQSKDDRIKILEAAIEAALIHLDGDAFRSAAIAAAKNQLEKALKRGRY